MIRAVIFDLGGVCFTNGTTVAIRRFSRILRVSERKLWRFFNPLNGYALGYRTGKISRDDFWSGVTEKLGVKYRNFNRLENVWKSSYRPLDGVDRVVRQVRKRCKVALLSGNVPEVAEHLMKKYRLGERFDASVVCKLLDRCSAVDAVGYDEDIVGFVAGNELGASAEPFVDFLDVEDAQFVGPDFVDEAHHVLGLVLQSHVDSVGEIAVE